MVVIAKWLTHLIVNQSCVGSNPTNDPLFKSYFFINTKNNLFYRPASTNGRVMGLMPPQVKTL